MERATLDAIMAARRGRRAIVLATDLAGGTSRVIERQGAEAGPLAQHVAEAFRTGVSRTVEAEGRQYFLNAYLPKPRLVVIGAVHISQALAPMAAIAGFDMEIIDPRTAFASAARFPDVPVHAEWPDTILERHPLDAYTAVAALTHDPKIDDLPLAAALKAGCFYVGALGSRKTHARRVERLTAMGLDPADIARILAPIGLDIGAANPAEIAVSILAQMIQSHRKMPVDTAGSASA